jgi:hypothetical protein
LVLAHHCKSGTTASTEAIRCFLLSHQLAVAAAVERRRKSAVRVVVGVRAQQAQMAQQVKVSKAVMVLVLVVRVVVAVRAQSA